MKDHSSFVLKGLVCEEARLHLLNSKRSREAELLAEYITKKNNIL
jgi:hypothetical protein